MDRKEIVSDSGFGRPMVGFEWKDTHCTKIISFVLMYSYWHPLADEILKKVA